MGKALERLTEIREELGLSSKGFALTIGMTSSGLHNMYTRKSRVSPVQALAVEAVHGISHHWILTGELPRLAAPKRFLSAEEEALLIMAGDGDLTEEMERRYLQKIEREVNDANLRFHEYLNLLGVSEGDVSEEEQGFKKLKKDSERYRTLHKTLKEQLLLLTKNRALFYKSMIQALYFGEDWETKKGRSKAYQKFLELVQMKHYAYLGEQFEECLQMFHDLELKLKVLFVLTEQQETFFAESQAEQLSGAFWKRTES